MSAKYYVYRNLHTKTFSVKYRGKVIAHPKTVCLKDVQFKVSESGRQLVISTKRKNVHATVAGTRCSMPIHTSRVEVTYNPYYTPTFIVKSSKEPVWKAEYVLCDDNKIYILEV